MLDFLVTTGILTYTFLFNWLESFSAREFILNFKHISFAIAPVFSTSVKSIHTTVGFNKLVRRLVERAPPCFAMF